MATLAPVRLKGVWHIGKLMTLTIMMIRLMVMMMMTMVIVLMVMITMVMTKVVYAIERADYWAINFNRMFQDVNN